MEDRNVEPCGEIKEVIADYKHALAAVGDPDMAFQLVALTYSSYDASTVCNCREGDDEEEVEAVLINH